MSSVIKLHREDTIAVVAMEEKEWGNTFTKRFKHDLMATFEEIAMDGALKVVVIHGYDPYFCCGGTQEELLEILEGKATFADLPFYNLLSRCELPVIAAMSGHAVGGGLVFGCYADIIVMGEQCIYSANFMKYGFTPGMGGTFIIPYRLGNTLGYEMLMTAENYQGISLKERGAPVRIVKKPDVIATAMKIAKGLANKPVESLKLLKQHMTRQIRAELPDTIKQELEMHDVTFTIPEVRNRIETLFGN